MESLTFKGSVSTAMAEAKEKKKLLIVYLSGKDEESEKLDKLTFTDAYVLESLSKYCVLLHARVDPTTFSATFPYSSVPCITAIGSSGVHVWNNEGFIDAVNLTSSIEKAWLGLSILRTTASIFGEEPEDEGEEPEIGGDLQLILQSRLTQLFNWIEYTFPNLSAPSIASISHELKY